ncbi:MAG: HAMP domain-containing histidine kinase, partial [Psychromonas sp.]|nr:HAMP domain-containing histidine kinase [Psychromonas sp.]
LAYLLLQRLLKRTLKPFHQLGEWVDNLTPENMHQPLPNFEFSELNRIAKQQQQTLQRIGLINKKEQDFLRHASHELRTPIAVVKSNSELLTRILKDHKASTSVARIQRAGLNMQHMTETLLWLSRDDAEQLGKERVDLALLLEQLIEDNQYLLQSKQVEIILDLDASFINVATTPCRLVLNNLIRNAFQYTNKGTVELSLHHGKICLKNVEQATLSTEQDNADYGYGLGLQLVDKIIDKMNWIYENQEIQGGRVVALQFDLSA